MLLLRACLCQGDEGLSAWREWSSSVDIERLDWESNRLLPLLYTKLAAQNIRHPWMGRMKGCYRYTWVRNSRLLAGASDLVKRLRDVAGNDQILLKGAAMACAHLPNIGLRSMEDVDMLVRTEVAWPVCRRLQADGWTPRRLRSERTFLHFQRSTKSSAFFRKQEKLDLHWGLLDDLIGSALHEAFWQASQEAQLPDGTRVKVLHVADQLFQTCLHGVRADQGPSPRWITDAATLIGKMRDEDWNRLQSVAEERRFTLRMGKALEFLREKFGENVPIPPAIIRQLLHHPHSSLEEKEYERRVNPELGRKRGALTSYREFVLHSRPPRIWGYPADYMRFLMKRWDLSNSILVPVTLAKRAMRKVWGKVKGASEKSEVSRLRRGYGEPGK